MVYIIKRFTGTEPYNQRKLHRSIYIACISATLPEGQAKVTARQVCKELRAWVLQKSEVTTKDVRHHASRHLHTHSPDAAFLYKYHDTIE